MYIFLKTYLLPVNKDPVIKSCPEFLFLGITRKDVIGLPVAHTDRKFTCWVFSCACGCHSSNMVNTNPLCFLCGQSVSQLSEQHGGLKQNTWPCQFWKWFPKQGIWE